MSQTMDEYLNGDLFGGEEDNDLVAPSCDPSFEVPDDRTDPDGFDDSSETEGPESFEQVVARNVGRPVTKGVVRSLSPRLRAKGVVEVRLVKRDGTVIILK